MSSSNRSRYVAIGLTLIALVVVFVGTTAYLFTLGSNSGFRQSETQHYQTEYAADTEQRIASCFEDTSVKPRDCVEKAIKGNHENQRNEADLNAQRDMADWAFWLLIVSSLSLGVTAVGTAFLAWQVQLTREAVTDTGEATEAMKRQNTISEQSLRPWIVLSLEYDFAIVGENEITFYCDLKVKNIGKSPAYHVAAHEAEVPLVERNEKIDLEIISDNLAGEPAPLSEVIVFPNETEKIQISFTSHAESYGFGEAVSPDILAVVNYRLSNGEPAQTSARFVLFHGDQRKFIPLLADFDVIEIESDRLEYIRVT